MVFNPCVQLVKFIVVPLFSIAESPSTLSSFLGVQVSKRHGTKWFAMSIVIFKSAFANHRNSRSFCLSYLTAENNFIAKRTRNKTWINETLLSWHRALVCAAITRHTEKRESLFNQSLNDVGPLANRAENWHTIAGHPSVLSIILRIHGFKFPKKPSSVNGILMSLVTEL